MSSKSFHRLGAALVALVIGLPSAFGGWAGVDDKAGFFSPSAKATAQSEIAELQRAQKKDFAIETFPTIPAEAGTPPSATDKAALGRFMEQWAEKQAREKRVNGIYALLVKSPAHLQIVVGNETQKKAFTLRDRDTLVGVMLGNLRAKNYDAALLDGVNFVKSTMRSHAAGSSGAAASGSSLLKPEGIAPNLPAKSSEGFASWIPIIVVGLVVWVVIALLRAMFRGGGSPAAPGMGGGGGGFMSSLFGGLFGAAAGMWMYDQFFGHGTSAFGSDRPRDEGAGGFSGEDTNYSGSGGDFGDSSGGSSGGDSGGGFGGGDFGGGGDSGGGGGGDF